MTPESLEQTACEVCGDCSAEVLVTERKSDTYGQQVLEIVVRACSECSEDLVKDGYRETPVFEVDPEVVEVEIRNPDDEEFVLKKRGQEDTEAGSWLKMDRDDVVNDLEARR